MADRVADPVPERDGEGHSPLLDLAGFTGRLERLLTLARAQQIDLTTISLSDLVTQLTVALQGASGRTPLGLQGDWVVMAAWLVLLQSRLLLPEGATQDAAQDEAAQLRQGLVKLGEIQAAGRWLEARCQLGQDVFARGRPEFVGIEATTTHQVDVIEFLWASLALFDDDLPGPDRTAQYRPPWLDLHAIPDARDRIRRHMTDDPAPCALEQLLPAVPGPGAPPEGGLRRRSRWTSTFVASLELAKQGEVLLDQDTIFSAIQVSTPAAALPD